MRKDRKELESLIDTQLYNAFIKKTEWLDYFKARLQDVYENDLEEVKKTIEKQTDAINDLINNNKYLKSYNDALLFITWFNWNRIKSVKLANEAKRTLIKDLPETKDKTFYEISKIHDENSNTSKLFACGDGVLSVNTDYWHPIKASYEIGSGGDFYVNGVEIKAKKKEETHEFKEYLEALVKAPFNYSKGEICSAVKYLKEVLEKDALVNKYKGD